MQDSVDTIELPEAQEDFDADGTGIAIDGAYVYLTASEGIQENGANGTTYLLIGQYRAAEDTKGVAPSVSITSPADGSTFIEAEKILVTVSATDDVGVVGVDLIVNGQLFGRDTSAPYQFTVPVAAGVGQFVLSAMAIDLGGNVAKRVVEAFRIWPRFEHAVLRLAQPSCSHHFHGFGDLLCAFDAADAPPDVAQSRHLLFPLEHFQELLRHTRDLTFDLIVDLLFLAKALQNPGMVRFQV